MLQIGKINKLRVIKHVDFGVFLDGEDDGEILLPLRYMPDPCDVGDEVDVFICYDSEDRLMATTEKPKAMVGDFALLQVVSVGSLGAFLDWGLPKDLFLPFAEQTRSLRAGQEVLVYIYIDKSDRLCASMRIDRHLEKEQPPFEEGQKVNLIIAGRTDLGFKAIIENRFGGVLYANEVFQPLKQGQKIEGYIKKIREDGKIDLSLQREGHASAFDDIGPQILSLLQERGGFLDINDKTPPEVIYRLFGVSKKKFKIALGGLYKKRLLTVDEDGIRLTSKS